MSPPGSHMPFTGGIPAMMLDAALFFFLVFTKGNLEKLLFHWKLRCEI
jgi:hypothetical protein